MIGKDTPPAFEGNIHILLSLKERDCANLINSKISAKNYTKNMMAPEVARNSYHNIKKVRSAYASRTFSVIRPTNVTR